MPERSQTKLRRTMRDELVQIIQDEILGKKKAVTAAAGKGGAA